MTHAMHARITFALVLASILAGCGEKPAPPARPDGMPVTTALVTKRSIPNRKSYPGIVASPRSINLVARVEGFLLKQAIADGAVTKPGDVVYRIDPRQYEASVLAAEGKLAEATAQRNYAKVERDRNEPLVKVNAISQQVYDDLVTKYESAEGEVQVAQANLIQAKLNLSYCTIGSPFPGLLGASKYFEGAVVGTADTANLNTLVQIDPLWVQFSPSSKEWPDYQVQLAKGPMTVTLTTDGDRPQRATGTIIFEDNQVNTKTSTLMLRAEFPNPGGVFRPGIYANVDVVLGDFGDAMVVPERAAFAREADIFVWRVRSDDTVESVAIKPLRTDGGELAFNTSRLQVGDRIVVDGIQRLKVGVKVIEMPAAAVPAAPGASAPAAAPKN